MDLLFNWFAHTRQPPGSCRISAVHGCSVWNVGPLYNAHNDWLLIGIDRKPVDPLDQFNDIEIWLSIYSSYLLYLLTHLDIPILTLYPLLRIKVMCYIKLAPSPKSKQLLHGFKLSEIRTKDGNRGLPPRRTTLYILNWYMK